MTVVDLSSVLWAAMTGTPVVTDAIPARTIEITPLTGENAERPREDGLPGFTASDVSSMRGATLNVTVDLAGSGAASTPPRVGRFLRASGMAETIVTTPGSEGVTYTPVDLGGSTESVNTIHWKNGNRQLATCRGTVELTFQAQQIPAAAFTLTGLYEAPTNTTRPSVTFGDTALGLPVEAANTPTFTLGNTSLIFNQLTFTLNATVTISDNGGVNGKYTTITNIAPMISATVLVPGYPGLATFDPFAKHTSGVQESLVLVHGPANNRVTLNANITYQMPQTATVNGLAAYQLELKPIRPTAGSLTGWFSLKFS